MNVDPPRFERIAAGALHLVFYMLLIVLPMRGRAMSSGATRRSLDWFGVFPIPCLSITPAAAGVGHDVHEVVGIAMAALVALHIAAALRHHLILRDGVMRRMLPAGRDTA